jgi:hypothetical protein
MIKNWQRLMNEEDGIPPAGGNAVEPGFEYEKPEALETPETPETPEAPVKPEEPVKSETDQKLEKILQLHEQTLQQRTTPAPKTEAEQRAELMKRINPVRVDANMVRGLLNLDPEAEISEQVIANFQNFAAGINQMAVNTAGVLLENVMQSINPRLDSFQQYLDQQNIKEVETRFYGQYKQLEPYKELVQSVAKGLEGDPKFSNLNEEQVLLK